MLRVVLVAVFLTAPARGAERVEPKAEPLQRTLAVLPASWHESIGEFLDSAIDEQALYGRLLILSQRRSTPDMEAAFKFAGRLKNQAESVESSERRMALAARYASLETVLSGFVSEDSLEGLRQTEERLLPDGKKDELLETARRTARLLETLRPDGAHLPAVGEFSSDDASMDLRAEIDLGFIRESLPKMKIDAGGVIFFEEDGFPDERSYLVAHKAATLLRDDPDAKWVRGDDRKLLTRLSEVFQKTEEVIFSKGNELVRTVRYVEPMAGGLNMSILRYVETEQFKQGPFWVSSNERTLEAPEGYADVDAQTARGPFLRALKIEEFIEKNGRRPRDEKELHAFKSGARSRFFGRLRPGPTEFQTSTACACGSIPIGRATTGLWK